MVTTVRLFVQPWGMNSSLNRVVQGQRMKDKSQNRGLETFFRINSHRKQEVIKQKANHRAGLAGESLSLQKTRNQKTGQENRRYSNCTEKGVRIQELSERPWNRLAHSPCAGCMRVPGALPAG